MLRAYVTRNVLRLFLPALEKCISPYDSVIFTPFLGARQLAPLSSVDKIKVIEISNDRTPTGH